MYLDHERVVVEFPFDATKQMALAPLKKMVDDWDFNRYGHKEWSYPLEAMEAVVEALAPFSLAYSAQATLLLERVQRERRHHQELATFEHYWQEFEHQEAQKRMQVVLTQPMLADGRRLYAHQQEAIERLVRQSRLILAHDLGLGKTLSSLLAAMTFGRAIFVIAPLSTHIPWLREAEAVGVPIEIYTWAKLPPVPEANFVLIGDEAQMIQNLETRRTKAFLALAERASAVFAVTGTPMKNAQATNLFPLLVACDHPLGQSKRAYEDRYCSGYMRRIGKRNIYEATGAINLDELHEKTRDVILHKRKSECLDLPPKIRVQKAAEVTPKVEQLYQDTIERLWQEHDARMEARAEKAHAALVAAQEEGADIDSAVLEAGNSDPSFARALVELGVLRHAGSLAKVDAALATAEEVQEQGGSVVIFSCYRDTARQIALALHADCLAGDTSVQERQAMIDRFQAGTTNALVCVVGAGGLGITLTAAQTVILVERPWTPGDVVQAEDRCIAEGQLVITEKGPMPIEAIKSGERVLTHTGKWQQVTATKKREHRGLMTRITYSRYSEPLYSTHDHKIFVKRGNNAPEWLEAHKALPGDFVVMPRPHSLENVSVINLPSQARYAGTFIDTWGVTQTNGRYKMLAGQFTLNNDLLWLFGWYLAEGFASTMAGKGRFISLSSHEKERPILERMQQTLSCMGVKSTIYANKKTKGIELRAFSYELAYWFSDWFGDGCENKRIPACLFNLPLEQAQTLIDAYVAGDGYVRKCQREWISVSLTLASQIALLALQCGHAPTLRVVDNETHNKGQWIGCYTVHDKSSSPSLATWDEYYVYHPIHKVETFFAPRRPDSTYVYDLTVEEDHSFVVGQAIVHNCHRIGQVGSVTSIWLQFGEMDDRVDRLLEQKQRVIDHVLTGLADVEASGMNVQRPVLGQRDPREYSLRDPTGAAALTAGKRTLCASTSCRCSQSSQTERDTNCCVARCDTTTTDSQKGAKLDDLAKEEMMRNFGKALRLRSMWRR